LAKGYGLADREHGVPCGPETKYRLGSLTKQFTAMLVMQLQELGKLSTDDMLSKYIPDYPNGDKITVHNLLTHTSGVPNFTSFPDYADTMMIPASLEELIARFKDKPLDFQPGEKFSYSNSGYILLSYIVEKTGGKRIEELLREMILDPLGMKNTGCDHNADILPHRARGYAVAGPGKVVNAPYIDMSIPSGAGAMYSTVGDLLIWDRALYTDRLISKSSREKMFTPFLNGYAYGWAISETGRKKIAHGGGINGFMTYIERFVDDDVLIVSLCNIESPYVSKVRRALPAIVFGERYEPIAIRKAMKVKPEVLEKYIGDYELKPGHVLSFFIEDGRFFTRVSGQGEMEVFAESESKFFLMAADVQINFVTGEGGTVTHAVINQNGIITEAKKIK